MGIFKKLNSPVVLKDESDTQKRIDQLSNYMNTASKEIKEQIEQDIRMLKYGLNGENTIMFELKNSHIPMYIMRDLLFQKNDAMAQIDFLIVTRKLIFVIECKNLYGNIIIDNNGNFIREITSGTKLIKKGIYSPVTQNSRHIEMIRDIRREAKSVLMRPIFDKSFGDNYRSVVVLSNPETVIKMRYAPKYVKEKIVRADGLINYIKQNNAASNAGNMSDNEMRSLADFFLERSVPNIKDYTEKYKNAVITESSESVNTVEDIESTYLYKSLKKYRYDKSKEENVKAYYIFNNAQLEELIRSSPESLDELRAVSGFGDVKCAKYGIDILKIISEHKNHV